MINPTPHDVGRRVEFRDDPDEDGRLGTLRGVGETYMAVRLDRDGYDRMIQRHRLLWWDPPLDIPPVPRGAVEITRRRRSFLAFVTALLGAQPSGARPPRRPRIALFRRDAP